MGGTAHINFNLNFSLGVTLNQLLWFQWAIIVYQNDRPDLSPLHQLHKRTSGYLNYGIILQKTMRLVALSFWSLLRTCLNYLNEILWYSQDHSFLDRWGGSRRIFHFLRIFREFCSQVHLRHPSLSYPHSPQASFRCHGRCPHPRLNTDTPASVLLFRQLGCKPPATRTPHHLFVFCTH